MSKIRFVVSFGVTAILTSMFFQNCADVLDLGSHGTATGNPSMHMSFAPYGSAAQMKASAFVADLDEVSVIFCFSHLRFKTDTGLDDNDPANAGEIKNIVFGTREVSVSNIGTDLGFVDVPKGTYRQVDLHANGNFCDSKKSIRLSNSHGEFSTEAPINLKFIGDKTVEGKQDELELIIQKYIEELATVTSDDEIKQKLEAADGKF